MAKLKDIDKKAESKGSGMTTLWQFVKFIFVSLLAMIVQFALKNLGVGCVVKDFAKEYVDAGLLFELRFNKIIPKRHFSVVLNRKTPLSVAAQKLLEVMKL